MKKFFKNLNFDLIMATMLLIDSFIFSNDVSMIYVGLAYILIQINSLKQSK
jgi:hypothetical protein